MSADIPACDICVRNDATSIQDGIYRCEGCELKHLRLEAAERSLARAQSHDHDIAA